MCKVCLRKTLEFNAGHRAKNQMHTDVTDTENESEMEDGEQAAPQKSSTGGAARVQAAGNPSKRLRNDDWEFVGFMEYESQSLRAQVVKFLTDKMVGDPENPSHKAIDELDVKSMVPNCFGIDNDVFATVKAHCVTHASACGVSYKFVLIGSVNASSIFEEAIGGMGREIVLILERGCQ